MSEYRHNLLTNQWVILAAERGSRPSDFAPATTQNLPDFDDNCPFCPGNELQTPPEMFALRQNSSLPDHPGWSVRVVPNKYPALTSTSEKADYPENPNVRPGAGLHEVIIESPSHRRHFAYHDPDHAIELLRTLRSRCRLHRTAQSAALICIFQNHGTSSGASLTHPHFQLIGPTIVPPHLLTLLQYHQQYRRRHHQSLFDLTLQQELQAGDRVILANDHLVAFCPFASMTPFEVHIIPRLAQPHFDDADDDTLGGMAQMMQTVLQRLDQGLGNPDYNMAFHPAPLSPSEDAAFRWFLQICPRTNPPGGFELATQMYINTVAPERAAEFYRQS